MILCWLLNSYVNLRYLFILTRRFLALYNEILLLSKVKNTLKYLRLWCWVSSFHYSYALLGYLTDFICILLLDYSSWFLVMGECMLFCSAVSLQRREVNLIYLDFWKRLIMFALKLPALAPKLVLEIGLNLCSRCQDRIQSFSYQVYYCLVYFFQ